MKHWIRLNKTNLKKYKKIYKKLNKNKQKNKMNILKTKKFLNFQSKYYKNSL